MSARRGYGPAALAQVALAALVGGLLAVAVLAMRRDISDPGLLGALVIAALVFCVVATARLTAQPGPITTPPPRVPADDQTFTWHHATSAVPAATGNDPIPTMAPSPRWTRPAPVPEPPADPGTPALSAAVPVRGGEWWQFAAASGGTAGRADARPAGSGDSGGSTLDLSGTTDTTRVVQCPRCGDFGVDVSQQQPGFAFRCRRCDNQWRWGPGAAWPVSVVRPRLGRRPASGSGSRSS
jgi:hypothetical protein